MTDRVLEGVLNDVKAWVVQAEALLAETAGGASAAADAVHERAAESVRAAKSTLASLEAAVEARARAAATETNRAVHEHPWTAVGVGAAIGVLLGLLIGRRER